MHAFGVPGTRRFSTVEAQTTDSVAGIPPSGRLRVPVSNRTDSPSSPAGLWVKRKKDLFPSRPAFPFGKPNRGSRCRRQWGTTSPKGVDPAREQRSRGQGELQVPRRKVPWAARRSRGKRPLLSLRRWPQRRPRDHREGKFFCCLKNNVLLSGVGS